jgi:hypothetical protein
MFEQIAVAHSRAPQILSLLHEYGPLSVRGLQTMIRPRITKRRLQECLVRLYEKSLVIRRFEATPFAKQYYELSQADEVRNEVNRLTGIPKNLLIQPYFRSQELLHNEECAFWACYLKEVFPDADVVRDINLKNYEDIYRLLQIDDENSEFHPDIALYFPESAEQHHVLIPFEIELTRKSDMRLFRKLRRYANATNSDGVVYLCRKNTLASTVSHIFKNDVSKRSPSISHYAHLFMLFGDRSFHGERLEPNLFNMNGEAVSLKAWVHTLRTHSTSERRDLKIATPA